MKNYFLLLCISLFVGISCSETRTLEDDLIGEWIYERETFNSSSSFEDPDTRGVMTFNKDETGTWVSDNGLSFAIDLEWDFQQMETKISITKNYSSQTSGFIFSRIYDITQTDEDSFTLRYELNFESQIDTIEPYVNFENIILTRS